MQNLIKMLGQLTAFKKILKSMLCFFIVLSPPTASLCAEINIKISKNGEMKITSEAKTKSKLAKRSRVRGRLITALGLLALGAYIVREKSSGGKQAQGTESLSSNNEYANLPADQSQPNQASRSTYKTKNYHELQDSFVVVDQQKDNWLFPSQEERESLKNQAMELAVDRVSQGYPRDSDSTPEEVQLIKNAGQLTLDSYTLMPPKITVDHKYLDYNYCQAFNYGPDFFVFPGFFVEDTRNHSGRSMALCQNFFDQAFRRPQEEQIDLGARLIVSIILLEAGMSVPRIEQLLSTRL